jgi:sphingomyelin phosphodiesterase
MDMEEDEETFQKYHRFSSKSSPMEKECVDDCKKNTICGIRAGKSELRCDYESDVFGGEGVETKRATYKPEAHNCALNMVSIRSQMGLN